MGVSVASRGENSYFRWRGCFGLPATLMRTRPALEEKASEICVPFQSQLSPSPSPSATEKSAL